MLRLPDECLALIASAPSMAPSDRRLLSMTCRRWRALLPASAGGAVDGRACLLAFGFSACARLGCPASAAVCDVFASAGAARDAELLEAAEAGCPVGPAVAGEAAERGNMDMLVWAWRRGAALDASVAARLARAPSHVVRWLALQGCPVELGLEGMMLAGNAGAAASVAECRELGPGVWMRLMDGGNGITSAPYRGRGLHRYRHRYRCLEGA